LKSRLLGVAQVACVSIETCLLLPSGCDFLIRPPFGTFGVAQGATSSTVLRLLSVFPASL
jgi:hypothetical protein